MADREESAWLTLKQVTEMWNVSTKTLRRYINDGRLPARKDERGAVDVWLIQGIDMATFAESHGLSLRKRDSPDPETTTEESDSTDSAANNGLEDHPGETDGNSPFRSAPAGTGYIIDILTRQLLEKDRQLSERDRQISKLIDDYERAMSRLHELVAAMHSENKRLTERVLPAVTGDSAAASGLAGYPHGQGSESTATSAISMPPTTVVESFRSEETVSRPQSSADTSSSRPGILRRAWRWLWTPRW